METICDGEPPRTVKCPHQNVISTVWASYGRQHSDICVDDDQLINTTCKSDYDFVLSMVQETCDDTNTCNLESNKDEYGDPPECQGVKKYLQMYYLCKSGKIFFYAAQWLLRQIRPEHVYILATTRFRLCVDSFGILQLFCLYVLRCSLLRMSNCSSRDLNRNKDVTVVGRFSLEL